MLWAPSQFAVKPELVLKSGFPAWGAVGDPNAATLASEPLFIGPQFGAFGGAAAELSVAFVSKASLATGHAQALPTRKRLSAVSGCRASASPTWSATTGWAPSASIPSRTP